MKSFTLIVILLFSTLVSGYAQKLPNKQEKSLYAPASIKIDGELSEWNDQLQARNPIDGLMYTISNDDENLYFSLVAPYEEACRKVLRGGITVTISKSIDKRKKNDLANTTVTFPFVKIAQSLDIARNFGQYSDSKRGNRSRDSLLRLVNQKAGRIFKTIAIDNRKVSLKNDLDVLAIGKFNKKLDFVYELAIPLKLLGLNINYASPFSYNICLNGESEEEKAMTGNPNAPEVHLPPGVSPPPPDSRFLPTDFWGEYTLAKKP